ncbi:hypothetical protein QYE76_015763 [Lolium multiflorum]|uniref:Transcription initiation factor IIB n=1 Tax=Lolium multiflorum TaxID=4521 RepID=A0AAD8U334_LOLMU|nr:hypothetical protein QYE76_015763 [Lolium multiflorum]
MEPRTLAEVRAADADTIYSLYFPEGRVPAAAEVGCVCVDYLTCSECERILGQSFLAIELAARKKQRTDPPAPVPVARVDAGTAQGLGMGSHGIEGSDAAMSGMADQLEPGSRSHPPSDGVEGSDAAIASMEDRLGTGSHPPSDGVKGSDAAILSMADRLCPGPNEGVEGFEAAISGMAARLGLATDVGERAKEVFRKMDESKAWLHGGLGRRGQSKDRSKGPLAYAACLSIVCRSEGSERSLRELALAAGAGNGGAAARQDIARLVAHIRKQLGEEVAGQATGIGMVSVSSYLRRFGVLIRLGEAEEAAALEAARRLEESTLDVPHLPESVAAAVVCLALERGGAARKPEKDVATATGIAYHTINRVCMILRPHAGLLFG